MLKRTPLLVIASRVVVFLLNACGSSTPLSVQDPVFANINAFPSANNPLSCVVKADVGNAVTVRVSYNAESGPATTPDFAVSSSTVVVPVLGLMPETSYALKLQAISEDGTTVESGPQSCLTGTLPSTLPAFTVSERAGAEPGYTMIGVIQGLFPSSSSSGGGSSPRIAGPLIVDHTGQIVWYRDAFEGAVTDWQKQPDGTYTACINQTYVPELGYNDNRYFQLDSLGNVTRTYFALGQWPTDNHELRLLSNGDALLMAMNSRNMDLTPWGGQPSVLVVGDILQRISPTGELVFAWDALDRLDIGSTDPLITQNLADADSLDFTHANAIDVSADGSYLISLRNLSQIIKVNQSGSIVWRLGGVDSDFQFVNDPLGRFSLQHGMRELPNGNILLFDNGVSHQPPQSRAVEYQLDLNAMTATLVWQYDADPHLFGPFMGFTQRLENGNTLITYGAHPVIREVNPAGEVVWELQGAPTDGFYRAIRIPSLY